jgi:hypothetical protein
MDGSWKSGKVRIGLKSILVRMCYGIEVTLCKTLLTKKLPSARAATAAGRTGLEIMHSYSLVEAEERPHSLIRTWKRLVSMCE